MAGAQRYLLNRNGRFFARLVVPKDLRPVVGKTELRAPLGPDRRTAMKLLPGAVASLQHQIAQAERAAIPSNSTATPARYPLAPDQIAASHYAQRLAFDDQMRNSTSYAAASTISIDDGYVAQLRAGVAGRLTDQELADLMGARIERFRAAGNLDAAPGSDEWRTIARALCSAELEALARVVERDEGDYTGQPSTPLLLNVKQPENEPEPISLSKLWDDYIKARTAAGFMKDGGKRMEPVKVSLRKFLGHNDARQVSKKNLLDWRDQLLATLSAKTVSDMYLSAVRSLFQWAHDNERLPENPAATVKQAKPKKQRAREAGYTDAEAIAVLKLSRSYEAKPDQFGYVRETNESVNAKRWVPILCAFTGARVSEITQLRKEDLRQEGDRWVIRITPDAGTMKAGHFRDVPLHEQVVVEGFVRFVEQADHGPLFHNGKDPAKFAAKAVRMTNQVGTWLRETGLVPAGVQPNYAWRHRFKTQARDMGADIRVVDAIQGHAGRTASDGYGDVSLTAKARVIDALPSYTIERNS
ncbi:tyrosine-type recombinase/integrase [Paracoccus versutus]|uniref:Site-specific recombinase XerD n=1 Tax=Paracoccus versutus TaxID=34007 RepID=A0A3D9XKX0_PARVE|nr:tyrosine-type recombinase/integrase [Paracoccus versutus]REF70271.1 site-specific recombinase XerD [Paracoccus versutus]